MSLNVTVGTGGRIVIPRALRERLNIGAGDTLEIDAVGDELAVRPVRGTGPLQKEMGIWVFRTGQPLPDSQVTEVLDDLRRTRDEENLGTTS